MVRRVPILENLTSDELYALVEAAEPCAFSNEEYIIRQGDIGQEFYIITRGIVAIRQRKVSPVCFLFAFSLLFFAVLYLHVFR